MAYLMQAFTTMLGDVTIEDASDRQIGGIEAWQELTLLAVAAGLECEPPGRAGMTVPATSSSTHRMWRDSAWQILAALQAQIAEAEARIAVTRAKIAKLEREAASEDDAARAAGAAAAAAEARAAQAEAAAAEAWALAVASSSDDDDDEDDDAAAYEAEARHQEAIAAAAHAEAAVHRGEQLRHERRAQECREVAAAERRKEVLLHRWVSAAEAAHTAGTGLVARENAIAIPVGQAIAAGGGVAEMPWDKWYLRQGGNGE